MKIKNLLGVALALLVASTYSEDLAAKAPKPSCDDKCACCKIPERDPDLDYQGGLVRLPVSKVPLPKNIEDPRKSAYPPGVVQIGGNQYAFPLGSDCDEAHIFIEKMLDHLSHDFLGETREAEIAFVVVRNEKLIHPDFLYHLTETAPWLVGDHLGVTTIYVPTEHYLPADVREFFLTKHRNPVCIFTNHESEGFETEPWNRPHTTWITEQSCLIDPLASMPSYVERMFERVALGIWEDQ